MSKQFGASEGTNRQRCDAVYCQS